MATEALVVEIDASTTKLEAALKKAGVALDDVDDKTKKTDSGLKKFTNTASSVASGISTVTKATLAAGVALSAMIVLAAKSQRELEQLSAQAKLSTQEFESLAFATTQYGINAEQIADISKDVADKLGEYSKTGSGAFQDYADVMGLTQEEAKATAAEFEHLSSDQVIGAMVTRLEAAGASGNEMTFVLESMGNDLSKLTPLFANQGNELNELTKRYKAMSAQLNLSSVEAQSLQESATSFDLMTSSLKKGTDLISAQLAPILNSFFNGVIDVVPTATQAVVNFINSFKSPEDIENLISVQDFIKESTAELTKENEELLRVQKLLEESDSNRERNALERMLSERKENVAELTAELEGLRVKEAELTAQRVADAEKLEGGSISTNGGSEVKSTGTGDQIKEIEDRFKTETALLTEKLNEELKIVGENEQLKKELRDQYSLDLEAIQQGKFAETYDQELLALSENYAASLELAVNDNAAQLELHQQFLESKKALDEEYAGAVIKSGQDVASAAESNAKSRLKNDKAITTEGINNAATLASSALSLASIAFEDNKGTQYAMTGINTAAGVMNQYASGDGLSAFARAAAVATTGIAQLAAIKSSTPGGSSIASVSSTAPTVTAQEEPDTINVDSQDTSGAGQSIQITFADGMSDEFTQLLSSNLKVMDMNGTLLS